MAKQMGAGSGQLSQISDKIEDVRFSEDACTLTVKGMGEVVVRIVEKEAPKMIKLGGDENLPFEFNLWIQLLENGPYDTRLRLTFIGELNFMLKMMLKGKLEKGINQFRGRSLLQVDSRKAADGRAERPAAEIRQRYRAEYEVVQA